MMLLDTGIWIEFLRKQGQPEIKQVVANVLRADRAGFTCPVLFEILSGARENELPLINDLFGMCERFPFLPAYWQHAAKIEMQLRSKGITVPRDDIFIAAAAHQLNLPILCNDKHFSMIKESALPDLQLRQLLDAP